MAESGLSAFADAFILDDNGDLVNVNIQNKDLSIKAGLTGSLIDTKMAVSMFLPIYLNTRHDEVQDINSHLWIVHKYKAFYLKC